MAKKQFKTESKRLLDLMINSIYTHREIFIRELVSNASDALDKRYYLSLTDENQRVNKKHLNIVITIDKDKRILEISDSGIGMNKEELESNLGTIAKSGSLDFKQEFDKNPKNIDIIGQFGVGFYSSFMIAKEVVVKSKACNSETSYIWRSTGEDGYTIKESDKNDFGTTISLHLKDNTDTENYDEFLDEFHLKSLIKKYSDYVRYPIQMLNNEDKLETINSMVPLWKKSNVKEEVYSDFYKSKFNDFEDPLFTIHYKTEGTLSYNALLFIPKKAPMNFYNSDYESGIQLYSKGVFILDKAKTLVPDHFRFIKGLVDSEDISLNISREILQQDRQMNILSKNIEKKIKSHLLKMLDTSREKYEEFFTQFGLNIKYGIYQNFGANKELLQDLLLYKTSYNDKYSTLKEITDRKDADDKEIIYVTGESIDAIKRLPQMEIVQEKKIEVIYLLDEIDEFAIKSLNSYNDKVFKSIAQADLDIESEEDKKEVEKKSEENKSLLDSMKDDLKDFVSDVRLSTRLKSHPVCLVSDGNISLEMEKVLANSMQTNDIKANKILEINPSHKIFTKLQEIQNSNPDKLKDLSSILYQQALLIEGFTIDNPVEYTNMICDLLIDK
ncbi:MAG: molecular chaperone HtpG [Anaerorhabdus sp.]